MNAATTTTTTTQQPPAQQCLDAAALGRLLPLLQQEVMVQSRVDDRAVSVVPHRLLTMLAQEMVFRGLALRDVRLEGSAATMVLNPEAVPTINDLDLVVHLASTERQDLEMARDVVLAALGRLDPVWQIMDPHALGHTVLHKMFITPATDSEAWALFTLGARAPSPSIDIKFVQTLRRPYQFSVDSFQIILDLAQLAPALDATPEHGLRRCQSVLPPAPPPRLRFESAFGDTPEALAHLQARLIAVREEEDLARVHGGGLLKYAHLLLNGFTCHASLDRTKLERYMCTRFMIDFPTGEMNRYGLPVQWQRIADYLYTHGFATAALQISFLDQLQAVLERADVNGVKPLISTVCFLRSSCTQQRPVHPLDAAADASAAVRRMAKRNNVRPVAHHSNTGVRPARARHHQARKAVLLDPTPAAAAAATAPATAPPPPPPPPVSPSKRKAPSTSPSPPSSRSTSPMSYSQAIGQKSPKRRVSNSAWPQASVLVVSS